MKEGDVVVVVGKLDERIREADTSKIVCGTIVLRANKRVWVLLEDGNFWIGPDHEVVRYEDQFPQNGESNESND